MKNLAALACAAAVMAPLTLLGTPAFATSDPVVVQTEENETTENETPENETEVEAPENEDSDEDEDSDEEPKVEPNRQPEFGWVKQVKSKGSTATVLVKYRCWGGEDGVVWASVAQGGELSGKTEAQIDAIDDVTDVAAVVYDTDASRAKDEADCNGRWQVDKYKLVSVEGTLRTGKAYVQVVVTDGSVAAPSAVEGDDLVKVKAKKVKADKSKSKSKSSRR